MKSKQNEVNRATSVRLGNAVAGDLRSICEARNWSASTAIVFCIELAYLKIHGKDDVAHAMVADYQSAATNELARKRCHEELASQAANRKQALAGKRNEK